MPRIIYRPRAKRDLVEILAYYEDRNPAAALKYSKDLEKKIKFLSRNPLAAPVFDSDLNILRDIRRSTVRNHQIFYTPNSIGIEIIRVLHSAIDIAQVSFN